MNTIRRFFRTVATSALEPQSYRAHLTERTSSGLAYLYWLLVCLGTITAVVLAAWYIPTRVVIRGFIKEAEPQIRELFPAELVLTLESGSLSTNVEEPYFIDPPFWTLIRDKSETEDSEDMPTHFLTIDTSASVDDLEAYDTAILATRTHLVAESDNELRAHRYSEVEENFILDKPMYDGFMRVLMPVFQSAPAWIDMFVITGLLLLPFVGAGFAWAWHLLILLIWTCFAWVLSAFMGKKLTYSQLYRLGLYGATLPVFYRTLMAWIPGSNPPLISTLIFLIFMGIVLSKITTKTVPAVPRKSAPTKKKAAAGRKKAK